ncbi:MAG TPA: cyclic nucleotide-binding domain-containing protein, partial [Saprospiraceae bacterium]|nr:cyclic nucleotide-binding domain-containing protein [Saprospiraceae bacterium]
MKQLIELSTKTIILKRNEYLKYSGSTDTNLYYLENGSMRIFIVSEGEEQIIRLAYNGNLITSLDSFLTDKPSELFIQAIKNSTVRVITKQQIEQFLKEDENQKLWIKILENLIVQQLEREIDILTKSPAERY